MVHAKLLENPNLRLLKSHIRQDVTLMECAAFGQNIFSYAPESRGAADYKNLCQEIMSL
jgi:chromosome partitioning protein